MNWRAKVHAPVDLIAQGNIICPNNNRPFGASL
jgi:hypothetical protein